MGECKDDVYVRGRMDVREEAVDAVIWWCWWDRLLLLLLFFFFFGSGWVCFKPLP